MRKAQLLWKFMVLKGLQINDYIFSCIRLFGYYVIPGIYLSYPLSPKTKFLSPPINKLVLRVCVCVFSLPSWKINVKVSGKSFFFFFGLVGKVETHENVTHTPFSRFLFIWKFLQDFYSYWYYFMGYKIEVPFSQSFWSILLRGCLKNYFYFTRRYLCDSCVKDGVKLPMFNNIGFLQLLSRLP